MGGGHVESRCADGITARHCQRWARPPRVASDCDPRRGRARNYSRTSSRGTRSRRRLCPWWARRLSEQRGNGSRPGACCGRFGDSFSARRRDRRDCPLRSSWRRLAHSTGVDRVFALGGAGAVAALAYGTQSVPRVDRIVGPGNAYVTAAKRAVVDVVGTDTPAGPSELLDYC